MRLSPARLLEERPGTLLAALTLLALALRLAWGLLRWPATSRWSIRAITPPTSSRRNIFWNTVISTTVSSWCGRRPFRC